MNIPMFFKVLAVIVGVFLFPFIISKFVDLMGDGTIPFWFGWGSCMIISLIILFLVIWVCTDGSFQ